MSLSAVAKAQKSIVQFPGWSKPDAEDGYSHFDAPLSIGGVTEAGLFLGGGTYPHLPDRHVTFELKCVAAGGRRWVKLMRLDWRSLRGGHTNTGRSQCPHPCPRRTSDTHFHSFDINWVDPPGKMRAPKLPCAVDVEEPLATFEALRAYVGKAFNINNIDILPPPEWEYKLDL